MSKTPPEDEPTDSSKNPDDSSKPESDQPTPPDLPPIPEAVREASLKKKDTSAPDDKKTASTVVEAEVITESESTDPPAGSYTIIGGDGDEYGPVSIEDVARWIRTDRANERTLVRSDEASQWQPLGEVPELALLLTGAPPPKPGKVKAIAIMTLVGGIWSVMVALGLVSGVVACLVCPCTAFLKIPSFCLIPSTIYSFGAGIFMIIQGGLLLGKHPQMHLHRTRWTASLQIGCLLAGDILNVILGILNHKFMSDTNVKSYQGERHTGNTIKDQN